LFNLKWREGTMFPSVPPSEAHSKRRRNNRF
jgi:hypothetical protein